MKIIKADPYSEDARILMDELSDILETLTGRSGRNSFDAADVCVPRSLFVLAYDDSGKPLGCGAIRPLSDTVAEVKRMYARTKSTGIGGAILAYLEENARPFGYTALWLETGVENKKAVRFYENRGYAVIENYDKYKGRTDSVCFEKIL